MKKRPDLRPAKTPLEATYSIEDVRAHFGFKPRKMFQLLALGKRYKGVHPTRGGLYPTYKLSHKCRRIPISAIERHKAHMRKLDEDPMFRAQMRAKARGMDAVQEGAAA